MRGSMVSLAHRPFIVQYLGLKDLMLYGFTLFNSLVQARNNFTHHRQILTVKFSSGSGAVGGLILWLVRHVIIGPDDNGTV